MQECSINEKQVSSLILQILHLHSTRKEKKKSTANLGCHMKCITYCIPCLRGCLFSGYGMRKHNSKRFFFVCLFFLFTPSKPIHAWMRSVVCICWGESEWRQENTIILGLENVDTKWRGRSFVSSELLCITSRYVCHNSLVKRHQ